MKTYKSLQPCTLWVLSDGKRIKRFFTENELILDMIEDEEIALDIGLIEIVV